MVFTLELLSCGLGKLERLYVAIAMARQKYCLLRNCLSFSGSHWCVPKAVNIVIVVGVDRGLLNEAMFSVFSDAQIMLLRYENAKRLNNINSILQDEISALKRDI